MKRLDEVMRTIERREVALEAVRAILVDALHVRLPKEDIDPDVALFGTGLGLDSIDAVELVVSLEAQLGVIIPDQGAARAHLRTVNMLVELVLRQTATELEPPIHGGEVG